MGLNKYFFLKLYHKIRGDKKKQILSRPNYLAQMSKSIYEIPVITIDGRETTLEFCKGKKMLIVNTASECGYTPQYAQLEELYEHYKNTLHIIAFPSNDFGAQEPLNNEELAAFCDKKYHISFPLMAKISVIGTGRHPLYKWLSDPAQNGWNNKLPTWNFCKYLLNEKGELLKYYPASVDPLDEEILSDL